MGGAADFVGDVLGGVVDVASDVIGSVAKVVGDNLPLVAAVTLAAVTGGTSLAADAGAFIGEDLAAAGLESGFSALPSIGTGAGEIAGGLQFTGGPLDNIVGNVNFGEGLTQASSALPGAALGVNPAFNFAAADATGLAQMAADAGLTGPAADAFVASGGTLGSTAAGGGGIGIGANLFGEGLTQAVTPPPLQTSPMLTPPIPSGGGAPVQEGPTIPSEGPPGITIGENRVTPTSAGAGTALSRILDQLGGKGEASTADWASVLGTAGATGLSVFSANRQADQLKELSDRQFGIGAPSRSRYEASFAPGFTLANEPGYTDALNSSSDALLRRLSATGGNPFGNPGGLIEANKQINASLAFPALQTYRNQNAATGGYNAFSTAAPGTATAAIGAQGGALTDLARGASDIFNPRPQGITLADLLKQFGKNNIFQTV